MMSEEAPFPSVNSYSCNHDPQQQQQQLPFNDQQLLDFYEQSLHRAFQQVEELKRFRRSRSKVGTWKGSSSSCICSSSSSKPSPMSTRRCSDAFKKSGGSGHGRRPSRTASIQIGDIKDEPLTSDGLMLAVDKFLTAEFRR